MQSQECNICGGIFSARGMRMHKLSHRGVGTALNEVLGYGTYLADWIWTIFIICPIYLALAYYFLLLLAPGAWPAFTNFAVKWACIGSVHLLPQNQTSWTKPELCGFWTGLF